MGNTPENLNQRIASAIKQAIKAKRAAIKAKYAATNAKLDNIIVVMNRN